jgi:hypothetical protein
MVFVEQEDRLARVQREEWTSEDCELRVAVQ